VNLRALILYPYGVLSPSHPDVLAPEAQVAALRQGPARRHPYSRDSSLHSERRPEDNHVAGTTLKRSVPIWLAAVTFSPK